MSDEQKTLVFIDREGKPGGGKGLLISKELTFTLSGLRQNLLVWEIEGEELSDLVMYRGQWDETEPFRSRNECKCTDVHAEHNRSSCGDV